MSAEKFLIFYGWVIALGGAGGIGAIWAGVKMNRRLATNNRQDNKEHDMKRFKTKFGVLIGLAVAATMLAGCSEAKTTEFSIGYVVKGGVDDSRGVDKILMPGTEST